MFCCSCVTHHAVNRSCWLMPPSPLTNIASRRGNELLCHSFLARETAWRRRGLERLDMHDTEVGLGKSVGCIMCPVSRGKFSREGMFPLVQLSDWNTHPETCHWLPVPWLHRNELLRLQCAGPKEIGSAQRAAKVRRRAGREKESRRLMLTFDVSDQHDQLEPSGFEVVACSGSWRQATLARVGNSIRLPRP